MGLWWKRSAEELPDAGGKGSAEARTQSDFTSRPGESPYSAQYETIIGRGHTRPTTAFGAPTLIWHVGVWPRRTMMVGKRKEECDPHDTAGLARHAAEGQFERRRRAWIENIDRMLGRFERKGRLRHDPSQGGRPKRFLIQNAAGAQGGAKSKPPLVDSGAVGMTLWWVDPSEPDTQRIHTAIRVRVHVDLTADYVTYCFYMDIGHLWDGRPPAGGRRTGLLHAIALVRSSSEADLAPSLDTPTPPDDLSPEGDAALLAARNLLYVRIWEEFAQEMEFSLGDLAGDRGEVFANFRGLVMAIGEAPEAGAIGTPAAQPFPKFSKDPRFDADGPEANTVIKAYWPFVRRITPGADYREFVACGVMNWRALYISALGASSQWDPGEERPIAISDKIEGDIGVREEEIAGTAHGTLDDDRCVWRRLGRDGYNHPVRYLLLTKGPPNARQIGRIVERINAMGTMRLFALKDWSAIKGADGPIRMLGQELDMITEEWSRTRKLVDELDSFKKLDDARFSRRYSRIAGDLDNISIPGPMGRLVRFLWKRMLLILSSGPAKKMVRGEQDNDVLDAKYQLLHRISTRIEGQLIRVGAQLDQLGSGAVGGLHYRINRSRYYVREFRILLKTLNVGNVPTWVSYEQFVMRGLTPCFDEISTTGKRLSALRDRLGAVTEMIETSALVGQSAATRHNTAVLRNATTIVIAVLAIYLIRFSFPSVWAAVIGWFHAQISQWDFSAAVVVRRLLDWLGPWVVVGAVLLVAMVSILYRLYRYLLRKLLSSRARNLDEEAGR